MNTSLNALDPSVVAIPVVDLVGAWVPELPVRFASSIGTWVNIPSRQGIERGSLPALIGNDDRHTLEEQAAQVSPRLKLESRSVAISIDEHASERSRLFEYAAWPAIVGMSYLSSSTVSGSGNRYIDSGSTK